MESKIFRREDKWDSQGLIIIIIAGEEVAWVERQLVIAKCLDGSGRTNEVAA